MERLTVSCILIVKGVMQILSAFLWARNQFESSSHEMKKIKEKLKRNLILGTTKHLFHVIC